MSNLSNLYVSQSFFGIINLENSETSLSGAIGDVQLQDGVGQNIGILINSGSQSFTFADNVSITNNLIVSGTTDLKDVEITGSVDISGSIRLHGTWVHTGSIDVLGDITASNILINEEATLSGDVFAKQDLYVTGEVSSSTVNGIGNVSSYSASVAQRTKELEIYSASLKQAFTVTGTDTSFTGDITAQTASFDTVNTRVLHATIESASVIFSSGSNILGDDVSDTQTLNGTVNIPNVEYLAGNVVDTNTRINNLNDSSASQQLQIDSLEVFTASADLRLTNIEITTASLDSSVTQLNAFSASVTQSLTDVSASFDTTILNLSSSISGGQHTQDLRIDSLEIFTGSFSQDFVDRPEFNAYTQSIIVEQGVQDGRLNNLETTTASLETQITGIDTRIDGIDLFTSSIQTEVNGLSASTSSYARLDIDNDFKANQVITGSVNGNVETITITASTASIDCSMGNFFKVVLPASSTQLQATNITQGQTISLRVTSQAGAAITTNNTIKFPSGLEYSPTVSGSYDLLTFVSFDTTSLLGAGLNSFNI